MHLTHLAHLVHLTHLVHLSHRMHLPHATHCSHLSHLVHSVHLSHLCKRVELASLAHLVHLVHLIELAQLLQRLEIVGPVLHAVLDRLRGGCGGGDMLLVSSSRVGVIVYSRVSRQLIGPAESLGAARELAGMWLLAGVGADMTGLVLQAMEGFVAKRALVGSWQIRAVLIAVHVHSHGRHGHRRGGHRIRGGLRGRLRILRPRSGWLRRCRVARRLLLLLRIQQRRQHLAQRGCLGRAVDKGKQAVNLVPAVVWCHAQNPQKIQRQCQGRSAEKWQRAGVVRRTSAGVSNDEAAEKKVEAPPAWG